MTTLQREILFFVLIIASLATALAVLIVILWAAWWVHGLKMCYTILILPR